MRTGGGRINWARVRETELHITGPGLSAPVCNGSLREVVPLLIDTFHKEFMNQDLQGQFVHREGDLRVLAHTREESLERTSETREVCSHATQPAYQHFRMVR